MTMRTTIFGLVGLALMALAAPVSAQDAAATPPWRHGTSLVGEPKYPEGFTQLDYVNPDAPKGGLVRLPAYGSFDTFNPVLQEGVPAAGMGLIYDSLMTSTDDEISTMYGLVAEAVRYPDDFSSVTFRLNPRAKWHDGEPVTADDVVWSFETLTKYSPSTAEYYHNVTSVEITAPNEVTFTFDAPGNRELPHIMGQLTILPKHWWEGTGPDGQPRNIGASTLEPPLGSGPYQLDTFVAGRSVGYKRVADYWGANEPVNVGQYNIDEIRYEYFRDTSVLFEAFKGDQIDWWNENLARRWAREYNFPAVTEGKVIQETFPNYFRQQGEMTGFFFNLRRDKFANPAFRRALNYAFNFEQLSEIQFFGQYERINSYFYGTELAARGLPEGEELAILNEVKDLVPPSVFTEEYKNPVGGDQTALRAMIRQGLDILTQAGYRQEGTTLLDPNGQPVSFELLMNGSSLEAVASNWQANLKLMGIDMTMRVVDTPQYVDLTDNHDFDVIYTGIDETLSPGNEQRAFWGSETANEVGTSNYGGIADPGVDALIERVVKADDRDTLIAATRALDRVLLAHAYVLPTYALRFDRIARWDRYGHNDVLPEFAIGFPHTWWWDEAKAAKTGAAQ